MWRDRGETPGVVSNSQRSMPGQETHTIRHTQRYGTAFVPNSVIRSFGHSRHCANSPCPGGYSITRSARTRMDCGMPMPRALAVFRLTISWNCEICSTGKSAGFTPFRIFLRSAAPCPVDLPNENRDCRQTMRRARPTLRGNRPSVVDAWWPDRGSARENRAADGASK